jgi:hypothetical protein
MSACGYQAHVGKQNWISPSMATSSYRRSICCHIDAARYLAELGATQRMYLISAFHTSIQILILTGIGFTLNRPIGSV